MAPDQKAIFKKHAERMGPLRNACYVCSRTSHLLRCSRCRVEYYCSREHQTSYYKFHKLICRNIHEGREMIEREKRPLLQGDWFEKHVGHFERFPETHAYIDALYRYSMRLTYVRTLDAVETALTTLLEMHRLCPSDIAGGREAMPALMIRLGQDQEAYDFVKGYAIPSSSSVDHVGGAAKAFTKVEGADPFEDVSYLCDLCDRAAIEPCLVVAVVLSKMRMLLGLRNLQHVEILKKRLPRELLDEVKCHIFDSSIVRGNTRLMDLDGLQYATLG